VKDCADCRGVVDELRRELAPEPAAVRVRFTPARGWLWALAGAAVAAALIAAVWLRPSGPGVPTPHVGPAPGGNVAEVPPEVTRPPSTPRPPGEPKPPAPTVRQHPGARHRHARPPTHVQPPEADIVNPLPAATAFAFAEPLAAHQATPAEVEELLRQGAVNDLPETAPLDDALVDEFYRGFDDLVQDLRTESVGAAP